MSVCQYCRAESHDRSAKQCAECGAPLRHEVVEVAGAHPPSSAATPPASAPPPRQPFPGNPDHMIKLGVLPFGRGISRSVFNTTELTWIDGEVKRVANHPDLWVPALMAHLEAHRILSLSARQLARAKAKSFTKSNYRLKARFVASWSVYQTLWPHYLSNKATLGAQLRAHPYEAEVLRNSKYLGAGISGTLSEFERTAGSQLSSDERMCPYCAEMIKAAAVVCRYCQRDVPPAVADAHI